MMVRGLLLLAGLLAAFLLLACDEKQRGSKQPSNAEIEGQWLYENNCAECEMRHCLGSPALEPGDLTVESREQTIDRRAALNPHRTNESGANRFDAVPVRSV